MNWLEKAKTYKDEFVELTTALLQIPTVLEKFNPDNTEEPFGHEIRQALDLMLNRAALDGFTTKNIDNYAGHIEYGNGDEIVGILGHLDVVPAGGDWTSPPFAADQRDGKIYARGAMDDKGPTVAAYIALKMVKEAGTKLNKRIRIILGCDEESGMRGIIHYLTKESMPDLGFAPDADFPLIYAEKGILEYNFIGQQKDHLIRQMYAGERYNVVPDKCEVTLTKDLSEAFNAYLEANNYIGEIKGKTYTIYGKNAHAAMPQLGVNAISLMTGFLKDHTDVGFIRFLDEYLAFDNDGNKLDLSCYDKEMKALTNNLAYIKYDGENVNIGCNIRYPRNYDFKAGELKMMTAAKKHGLTYDMFKNSGPHYVSPDDPLVQTLHDAYVKYTGDTTHDIITIGGGTYARRLKKAVAFGPLFPGEEELAHQADEFLDIDKMLTAIAIYAESIEKLAGA